MSPAVRRRDGTIEVETSRLRLRLDLEALQFDLCSTDAATRLVGCRPCVRLGARELYGRGATLDGFEEIDSPLGPATRLRLRAGSDAGLDLELDLEVGEDWPGIVASLATLSRADAPVRLTALEPLGCTGVTLPGDPAALRFYRMGYQSWSPAGRLPLGGPGGHDARPRPGVIGKMHFGPFTPSARRGFHVSDWVASLGADGEPGVTLGFLTHRTSLGHVALEHGRSQVDALRARSAAEDLALAPGESFASERLWVGLDPAGSDGIAAWAERAGVEMGAPVPGEVGAGWCSWYHFFTRVGAEEIRRNAEALGPYRGQLETVQIDDGFQAQIGDWLEPDDAFPGGVAPVAAAIRDSGFRAGLWLAPFIASRTSRLAREHPDWLLRDGKGKPVWALWNPGWAGRWMHALDLTHPEVLAWLGELIGSVRGMGFDYLKLDFLYAGALAGRRSDPAALSAETYRRGLGAIRQAAGDDAFLLGCGAPLGPSIGLVDSMRIGPDVAPSWSAASLDRVIGVPSAPAARNSIRNVLARSALHQRLWVNDPDCVLVRDRDTGLGPHEVESVAAAVALSGGLVIASDDMGSVSPQRREMLRRLLPPLGLAPEISRWSGDVPDEVATRFPDGSVLVLRLNLASRAERSPLDPSRHGLSGRVRAYDVWADSDLGTHEGSVELGPIPPHGCRLLRLTPADGRPRVIGSTLHISAGALETRRLEHTAGDRATLELALPGPRSGRVLVSPPAAHSDGEPTAAHVWFEDRVELELLGEGLVQTSEMDDSKGPYE